MKKNKLRFDRKSDSVSAPKKPAFGKSTFGKLSTWEMLVLASLPVDAALLYHFHSAQKLPVVATAPTEAFIPKSTMERVLPPIELEPIKVAPLVKADVKKIPVVEKATQPEIKPQLEPQISADLAEEIRLEKEQLNDWGAQLVHWNQDSNKIVKDSMAKMARELPKDNYKKPRYVGRMIYAYQNEPNFNSNAVSANGNTNVGLAMSAQGPGAQRSPTSVYNIDHTQIDALTPYRQARNGGGNSVGGSCSPNPPANLDQSCRANYPCRICGGCCCRTEARIAGLIAG